MRNSQLYGMEMVDISEDNVIVDKSKFFAIRIIKLYKYLNAEKKEYILSKQLLRSGTSIGANVKEAIRGQSKADFYAKMNISLKEASETEYWLELLFETDYISQSQFDSIYGDCKELLKLLTAITKIQKFGKESNSNLQK
ncbi:MAG: four helix bundle protein [Oscillospiraceae bacterium]